MSACKTYKFPDAKLRPKVVCGFKACEPGQFGIVFPFYDKLFSPDVDSTTTLRDVATSIIGHAFPVDNRLGDRALKCSLTLTNPFTDKDVINLANPSGKKIKYKKTEKLELDVNAAVEGNLEEIKKLNPGITNLPEIEAKLKAAYSKVNDKELVVQAKYSEWGLHRDAMEKLLKGGYLECKDFLVEKKYNLITAVGIVSYDITLNNTSLDKISADLEAEMTQQGIKTNLAIGFKREVNESLETSTKGGFQIVVWRFAPPDMWELK
ncbi:MAG: hypothetical protein COB85_02400 [Bacteroidetes bacterium]|nr:MAG: hypothetical protein COB85_02400 [Bacteroidota bacterium]